MRLLLKIQGLVNLSPKVKLPLRLKFINANLYDWERKKHSSTHVMLKGLSARVEWCMEAPSKKIWWRVAVFGVDFNSVLQIIFKSFEWCDFLFNFFIHKIRFQFMISSLLWLFFIIKLRHQFIFLCNFWTIDRLFFRVMWLMARKNA